MRRGFSTSFPNITKVANSIKLVLSTFETKGKLLDALRLHSITFMSLSLARNCMLKGPLISRALAIWRNALNSALGFEIYFLGRKYDSGIARVNSGKFYMLAYGISDQFAIFGHSIYLNFFGQL